MLGLFVFSAAGDDAEIAVVRCDENVAAADVDLVAVFFAVDDEELPVDTGYVPNLEAWQ